MAVKAQSSRTFFRRLKGSRNAFAMLMFEPMFGIPYNLFIPYFSLYMKALGCTAEQIGLISTIGMVFQMFFTLLASPITDRLGRNRTTLVFDIVSWSGVILIWIFARNFYFFLAAAIVQSVNRVIQVSWTCLMVEDTEKDLLVTIFSWFTIAGLLSAVFSPVAAAFVRAQGVVPAMQWLMAGAFVLITAMFFLRNAATRETSIGRVRMEQSRREPLLQQVLAVFKVTRDIWRNRLTLFFFILSALYNAAIVVRGPYFALMITEALHFNDESAGYFAAASSGVMLLIYLFALPVLTRFRPKAPLSVGLLLCAAGSLLLIPTFPTFAGNLAAVIVSVVLNAAGTSVAQPFIDGISHGSIDNEKRAGMTSILLALVLLMSAPFGWLGGWMYTLNARIPFLAASALFILCAVLMIVFYREREDGGQAGSAGDGKGAESTA